MHVIDDEDIKEADAAAEQLHKQQHFQLWPDGPDPNLFALGIYSFDIAMTLFLGAVKATYLPERQADTCIVDITSTYLQVRSRTKTRDCEITARAPLQSNSQIGDTGVSFEINKKVLRAICEAHKPYTLQMTYNSPEKSLSWSLSERDPRRGMTKIQVLHINVPVAAASSETRTPSCSAYSLPNRQKLYDAAEYLGILGKQQYEQSPISGVQFADGFLYGV